MFGCLTLLWGFLILRPASAFIRDGTDVYATAGETVSFPCALATKPTRPLTKPSGSWSWQPVDGQISAILSYIYSSNPSRGQTPMRDRTRMEGDVSSGNFALSLMQVQKADEGRFTCSFEFGYDKARSSHRLRLLQVNSSVGNWVLSNEKVTLSLSLPLGSVEWTGPEGTKRTGPQLQLWPPLKPGRQAWNCRVTHRGGSLEAKYSFEVFGFTHKQSGQMYLKPHQTVTLPCVLSSLPPNLADGDEFGWFRDGSPFLLLNKSSHSGQGKDGKLSVQLRAEEVADSSSFECRLSMGSRTISTSVRVCVVNVTSDYSGSIQEFNKTSVTCAVSPICPITHLTWVRADGTKGNGAQTKGKGSVTMSWDRVEKTQAGAWLCQLYEKENLVENVTYWMNVTVLEKVWSTWNLIVMVGLGAGSLLMLVFLLVLVICLVKRSRRRRRAVRRLRHPLCREHGNQLSNQPLCQGNDYFDSNRAPVPPPFRHCPHNPPRKGRSSRGNSRRVPSQAIYVT